MSRYIIMTIVVMDRIMTPLNATTIRGGLSLCNNASEQSCPMRSVLVYYLISFSFHPPLFLSSTVLDCWLYILTYQDQLLSTAVPRCLINFYLYSLNFLIPDLLSKLEDGKRTKGQGTLVPLLYPWATRYLQVKPHDI